MSVNHSWIFHVLEKAELPRSICRFLQSIYVDSIQRLKLQGKPEDISAWPGASDKAAQRVVFLFAMSLDPIFRWLHDSIIPRNPAVPDFHQPSPCAYADDFAVAASSFGTLMTALSPAFVVVGWVAGLNLNHWKCCWVHCGSDKCHELLDWVSTNCEEFCEMKIVKVRKIRWHNDRTRGLPSSLGSATYKSYPQNQENK